MQIPPDSDFLGGVLWDRWKHSVQCALWQEDFTALDCLRESKKEKS